MHKLTMTYSRTKPLENGESVTLTMSVEVEEEQPIPSLEYGGIKYWVDNLLDGDKYLDDENESEDDQ